MTRRAAPRASIMIAESHSITSSAWARTAGKMVSPSVWAVFEFEPRGGFYRQLSRRDAAENGGDKMRDPAAELAPAWSVSEEASPARVLGPFAHAGDAHFRRTPGKLRGITVERGIAGDEQRLRIGRAHGGEGRRVVVGALRLEGDEID